MRLSSSILTPIAMVIISMVAIPIYRKLNVYTAYEYLENRFDLKTRTLGAILFLLGEPRRRHYNRWILPLF